MHLDTRSEVSARLRSGAPPGGGRCALPVPAPALGSRVKPRPEGPAWGGACVGGGGGCCCCCCWDDGPPPRGAADALEVSRRSCGLM